MNDGDQAAVSGHPPAAIPAEVVADQVAGAVARLSSVPPVVTGSVPAVDRWPGPHGLDVTVLQPAAGPSGARQPPFVFSTDARKLYTDLLVAVPFRFRCAAVAEPAALLLRARPVYLEAHHQQTTVRRCALHRDPSHVSNAGWQPHVRHVLRAEHTQASYCEDGGWCSVTFPLECDGSDAADYTVPLIFCCMNTCVGGINRRRLLVVFSLEECSSGRTLGRQSLEVKVCRCPRRDWRADQTRRAPRQPPPAAQRKRPRPASPPAAPPPLPDAAGRLLVQADDLAMYHALLEQRDSLRRYRQQLASASPAAQRDTPPPADGDGDRAGGDGGGDCGDDGGDGTQ